MAKPNRADATILAEQEAYAVEIEKLKGNWSKLTAHLRMMNALLDQLPDADASVEPISKVKAN